jgi:transcription antitermination factor NusG
MGRGVLTEGEIAAFVAVGRGVTRCPPVKARHGAWARPKPAVAEPQGIADPHANAGRHWYVAAVEPGRDYRVCDELRRGGLDAWLPECRVRRRDARRGVHFMRPEPVFPGYLLVRVDLALLAPEAIEATEGVDCLLRRAGDSRPCPLPGAAVAALKREIDAAHGVLIIEAGACHWKKPAADGREEICAPGEPVRVLEGPFTGFNALYLQRAAADRIKILLDIFGRSTAIEIEEALVEPV